MRVMHGKVIMLSSSFDALSFSAFQVGKKNLLGRFAKSRRCIFYTDWQMFEFGKAYKVLMLNVDTSDRF